MKVRFAGRQGVWFSMALTAWVLASGYGVAEEAGAPPAGKARVSFHFRDITEQPRVPEFDVYPDLGGTWGHPELAYAGDLPDLKGFFTKIADAEDPIAAYLRGQVEALPEFKVNKKPRTEDLLTALNKVLSRDGFYEAKRFEKVVLSPGTRAAIELRTAAGDTPAAAPLIRALNRDLLEDAWPTMVQRRGPVGHQTEADRWCVVAPGIYWLVPVKFRWQTAHVTVRAGQSIDFEQKVGRSVLLKFATGEKKPDVDVLLSLKSDADMRQGLFARLWTPSEVSQSMLRFEVPATERDTALRLARQELPRLVSLWKATPHDEAHAQKFVAIENGARSAMRILRVLGDSTDARLLAETDRAVIPGLEVARVVGYLENRLGLLEHGELARAMEGEDRKWAAEAAATLHSYGFSGGDRRLREALGDRDVYEDCLSEVLLNDDQDGTLEGMRAAHQRMVDGPADRWRYWAPMLYLLAHGNAADRMKVAGRTLPVGLAEELVLFAQDPRPLIDLLVRESGVWTLSEVAPALGSLPDAEACRKYVEDAVYAEGASGHPGQEGGPTELNTYRVLTSWFMPNRTTADFFLRDYQTWCTWVPCIPDANTLNNAGIGWDSERLDLFPLEDVAKAIPVDAERVPGRDVTLAALRVLSRKFSPPYHTLEFEYEHRPFSISDEKRTGWITGVLMVRPSVLDKTLHLKMLFLLVPAHAGYSFGIGDPLPGNYSYDPYVANGGGKLLGTLTLARGGKRIEIGNPRRDAEGFWNAQVDLDSGDLSDTWLQVNMSFIDKTVPLVVDLFASSYVNSRRAIEARLPAARERTRTKPDDLQEWFNLGCELSEAGRISEAREAFERVNQIDPKNENSWHNRIFLFRQAQKFPEAIHCAREALKVLPDDRKSQLELVDLLFGEADYAAAAQEGARLLELQGVDSDRLFRVANLLLAGELGNAAKRAKALAGSKKAERAVPLWVIAAQKSGAPDLAEAVAALTQLQAAEKDPATKQVLAYLLDDADWTKLYQGWLGPVQVLRSWCYMGFRQLRVGDVENAKARFESALTTGLVDEIEYRLAKAELEKLKK